MKQLGKRKESMIIMSLMISALLVGTGTVYAETFTVEINQNGFSTNSLKINEGDSLTFVNTHYVTDVNLEPHAISDPFAVPYTVNSYYVLDDSTKSQTYTIENCESHVFHDRFFDVEPVIVECGNNIAHDTTTEPTQYVQPSIDTASDTSDQNLTIELTLALEKIGILQNKVTSLEDDTFVLQSQLNKAVSEKNTLQNEKTELQNHISVITQERDYFEEQWGNWKAVAMEQIRVMIDVLGL
jgi:plastocyanin